MLRALLRKQLLELNSWLFLNKKTGEKRSRIAFLSALIGYVLLLGAMAAFFGITAYSVCEPLVLAGLPWLYFTLAGGVSVLLGVFGSVFSTYASLYAARDNELLLSMPIPPRYVMGVRLFGVWLLGTVYSSVAYLPAVVVYQMVAGFAPLSLLLGLLTALVLSLFVLALSALLGFAVARISGFLKRKSLVTVLVSLVGIALYYLLYFKAIDALGAALENLATIGESVQSVLPLFWLGDAAVDGPLSLLWLLLSVLLLLFIVLLWMDRSFLKMATLGGSAAGRARLRGKSKCKSPDRALLHRELRRLTASATYMLNSALGTVMVPAATVFLVIKRADILPIVSAFPQLFLMVATALLCMVSTMNNLTAPSVSLEGKSLWLAQSLPVSPWQVLKAKLTLHLLLTLPVVIPSGIVLGVVLAFGVWETTLMVLCAAAFVLLFGAFGLVINLLRPVLIWQNETVPVKQSLSVTVSLFGSWAFVALLGALYYLLAPYLSAMLYLGILLVLLLLCCAALLFWLYRRGSAIFAQLS